MKAVRNLRRGNPATKVVTKVTDKQAEDLILRDFIISAASLVNAAGYNNGDSPGGLGVSDFSFANAILDKLCVETKSWVIDLEFLAAA